MYWIKALKPKKYEVAEDDSLNWLPAKSEIQVLEKHKFQCDCCGIISRPHRDYPSGYLEILDQNDIKPVLCSMCMQSQQLSRSVNGKVNHGLIIYCPTLSQGEVIKLAQWAYIARLRNNKFASQANTLIAKVTRDLVDPVSSCIPDFTSGDVKEFCDLYEYLSPKLKDQSETIFADLRYWPNETVFEKQIKFWDVAAFNNISEN